MFTGVELCNLATFACASEFTFGGRGQHVNLKDWNFWNCCTYGSYSCIFKAKMLVPAYSIV